MQPLKLCSAAAAAAATNPALAAFDPTILLQIFNTLFPMLTTIFSSFCGKPTPALVQMHVRLSWTQRRGYSRRITQQVGEASIAAGHQNDVDLTGDALTAVTTHALDAVRTAAPGDVQAVLDAATPTTAA